MGMGEPLCFMAFGPLATAAFYLAQLPPSAGANAAAAVAGSGTAAAAAGVASVPAVVWVSSVLVGITTTVILFCSHFHQIKGDTAAGKRSPLVRLGTEKGCQVGGCVGVWGRFWMGCSNGCDSFQGQLSSVLDMPKGRYFERKCCVMRLLSVR